MENEQNKSFKAQVKIDYLPSINYAMLLNGYSTCNYCEVRNEGDEEWRDVELELSGEQIATVSARTDLLRPNEQWMVRNLDLEPQLDKLMQQTENVSTTFCTILRVGGQEVCREQHDLTLLAYDNWSGMGVIPELLAAFVTSGHPALAPLKVKVAKNLDTLTGSSALDGYQTQDPNRVRAMVASAYEALRSEGLVYSEKPPLNGGRIRLADEVLDKKMGNCLDFSLLFASLLESMGLYPILVLVEGHIFAGAWLIENTCAQNTSDDASYLLKCSADGIHEMVFVETTMIAGDSPFEDAVTTAMGELKDEKKFELYVDVHRCRLSGIRPIPQRVMEDGKWKVAEGVAHKAAAISVEKHNRFDIKLDGDTKKSLTKQMIWERKLLDFSLRNNLLNTKLGKKLIPFVSFNLHEMENQLQDGKDYQVLPYPEEGAKPQQGGMYDSAVQAQQYKAVVEDNILHNKLLSYLTEGELKTALKYIYRTARTSLEENGANSLFLSLGLLKWYETDKSVQPRFAPLILVPVDIVRKGGAQGYVLRLRDEEVMLNTSLTELLKQQFNINLGSLNPLPEDDKGVDVSLILSTVREAVKNQKRWDVCEEALLGLYSFRKFVMWNDIHTNAEKLKDNQVIATLMANELKWKEDTAVTDAREIDKTASPLAYAVPMDVDSSQMEAVIASGEGKSFILHGPPGTGKSQTITNMIANALYQGKRVLFVAEKMAALTVVQKRLKKVGLDAFCLELHSNKVTKSHFLAQMQKALNAGNKESPAALQKTADELFALRKELIKNMELLHLKHDSGYSLYDAILQYLVVKGEEITGNLPEVKSITAANMEKWRDEVGDLSTVFRIVGKPADHVLYGMEPNDTSAHAMQELKEDLQQLRQVMPQTLGLVGQYFASLQMPLDDTRGEWLWAKEVLENTQQRDALAKQVLQVAGQSVLGMDTASLRKEWDEINGKWWLKKVLAKKEFVKRLGLQGGDMDGLLQKKEAYDGAVAQLRQLYMDYHNRRNQLNAVTSAENADALSQVLAQKQRLDGLLQKISKLAVLHFPEENMSARVAETIDGWLQHFDKATDWSQWVTRKHRLQSEGLSCVADYVEQGKSADEAWQAFSKGCYHRLIMDMVDNEPTLRMFKGLLFEDVIAKYKAKTTEYQKLTKEELYHRLAAAVPRQNNLQAAATSELGILKRNISNGGRGTTIRKIMDQIPNLLPRLCPCMLMSPLSVAQFIDLDAPKFDIVVFDEASQMPTSEAIGAIARGKALIVVGDPMQMPPTSFFETSQVDEEEAEYDDMESILDDCIALSIPSKYLNWHYRSTHESLIAFSNSQYYDGRLYTFPSVDNRHCKVSLVKINGTYDKGKTRCNPDEAKAIVEEVVRRLKDPELSKYSIGIVSFSKAQQDLIEDCLNDELAKYPELEAKAYDAEEPVFVKNLENVQGDERDVILFSVGYGPDKYGKVSMNFGPLNNEGGERRLNVAVSRSRVEMKIFSTLGYEQIDLRRSNAKGVQGLKLFLEFAEKGLSVIPTISSAENASESILIADVAEEVRRQGFQVDTLVGKSNFKIDIAVVDPKDPERYIMGIMCDGKNYYETKTTRDREICQPNVLKMFNWNIFRLWTIDWYHDRQQVIDAIVARLHDIQNPKPVEEKPQEVVEEKPQEVVEDPQPVVIENKNERVYVFAKPKQYAAKTLAQLQKSPQYLNAQVAEILKTEQPVTGKLLYKRVAALWGLNVTNGLKSLVDAALSDAYQQFVNVEDGVYYWTDAQAAADYPYYRIESGREVGEIPTIELMNACKTVVEQGFSTPRKDVSKAVAKLMGFRNTQTAAAVMNRVVDKLVIQGVLLEQDGKLTLNNG